MGPRVMGDFKDANPANAAHPAARDFPSHSALELQPSDLLTGDVLLYRPRAPNLWQTAISAATDSPYTHAAIYIGGGQIADSMPPWGVRKHDLNELLRGSLCVGVLRTQLVFSPDRADKLRKFVEAVTGKRKFYNAVAAMRLPWGSRKYFGDQLEFVRNNYGKVTPGEGFAKQSFFCSAFVVACYTVVGIIGPTAQVAYQPDYFAPGHLLEDPSFGWLLGYLVPEDRSIPGDDPLLSQATPWRDVPGPHWWQSQ
jgi:hypothetical protein